MSDLARRVANSAVTKAMTPPIPASAALTRATTATARLRDRVILNAMTFAKTATMARAARSFIVAGVFRLNTATASMW